MRGGLEVWQSTQSTGSPAGPQPVKAIASHCVVAFGRKSARFICHSIKAQAAGTRALCLFASHAATSARNLHPQPPPPWLMLPAILAAAFHSPLPPIPHPHSHPFIPRAMRHRQPRRLPPPPHPALNPLSTPPLPPFTQTPEPCDAADRGGCSPNADCAVDPASGVRTCTCKLGWAGNGETCSGGWVDG